MSYEVRILRRAIDDLDTILAYIAERSPEGADRLLARFREAMARLERNPYTTPVASESSALGAEVRHVLSHTRSGRKYRALFVVVGDEVRVLRIRGSGQPPLGPADVDLD